MTWPRYGLLVVALLVAGSLIVSTGGVSTIALDRNVDGAVVSDDEAYLGVERGCDNSALQVTITNRFSSGTTLAVNISVDETTKTIDDLAAGESQMKAFDTFDTDDTITIHVSGSGITARLNRSVPAEC